MAKALDSATPKLALQLCNKALKKQPDSALIKALKALALIRAGKLEECIALADQLVAAKPVDENTLSTLSHVLRALDRPQDVVNLYDDAYKQHPNNEELGCQAFIAMAKMGSWRTAQQTALRLNRTFPTSVPESRYAFWAISCMMMQARAPDTPRTMKPTLLGLALRMIEALPKPGAAATPDKVWLHMSVLIDLGKIEKEDGATYPEKGVNRFNKALELIVQSQQVVQSSLVCEELRKEAMMLAERYVEEREQAGETPIPAPPAEGETESKPVLNSEELYAETVDVFTKISQKDGADERAAPLSLIQLEVDRRKSDVKLDSVAPDNLYTLLTKYFEKIGSKACCYDDLADAIASLPENGPELGKWIEFLENQTQDLTSVNGLRRAVNVAKMLRTGKPTVEKISPEDEVASARKHLKAYLDAAPICENYPETEQQPRDDLAILAASAMVSAYTGSGESRAKSKGCRTYPSDAGKASYLTQAIVILEFALSKSPYNARFRILLTRLYRLIGAPTLAHEHYKGLRIKQTQHDTLSYLVLARASTFCMAGDSELVGECIESSQIYTANVQETPELVARAFVGEKFAQIPNFVEFEEKLECSLQRDLTKMEHTRMRLGFEAQAVESLVLELQDLQLTIVRAHHDNRDMSVIPNYQPRGQNIVDQTSMGPSPGLPWLNVFLQIYIRALEDSLGPAHFTGREYSFDDESQLTPLEAEFRKFTDNLNEWLVIRELPKTDKAAPGENGAENTNGGSETPKNGADVPALAAGVIDYFEGLYKKFGEISKDETKLPWESLHIAGLAQEALVLFEIQSAQFKVPTTGKAKKEPVAQGIKGIRPRASKALKDLATAMVAFGEEAGSEAKQKSIIEDCKDLEEFAGAKAQTVVNNIAKRIAGARKSVFEGWGKGMLRSLI
ncbi:N-alpha-acetyltransferase 25, NatB auxiliary subunit OS=Rattus norvegicus GN=Naa25 PE=2 SV=1 [Rhizoctonia solani AG-1 IB]|uniref:N-alpha-acetyltransferase 25, NatB auxiliary subunit n=1 Tax=Thanatephorus cucumeris (strain AG1-IB / isolate 7/3/14) TaxID=1108050 RepID=A0A0B7F608_THACB|nr:N-alpha-acetyltransferase 25, NatB auxiliary subunit OS=Rattus norvegicus GN=Naa25 PE=2 SV=1 [Rhizoctonia solani AG-1 IB]